MDLHQLKFLSDEDKDRYMTLERLWSQPGWNLVVELCQQLVEAHKNSALFAKTWEQNRMALGSAMAYDHIARLQDLTEAEYSQKVDAVLEGARANEEEAYE